MPDATLSMLLNITQPLMNQTGQLRWAINNVAGGLWFGCGLYLGTGQHSNALRLPQTSSSVHSNCMSAATEGSTASCCDRTYPPCRPGHPSLPGTAGPGEEVRREERLAFLFGRAADLL